MKNLTANVNFLTLSACACHATSDQLSCAVATVSITSVTVDLTTNDPAPGPRIITEADLRAALQALE